MYDYAISLDSVDKAIDFCNFANRFDSAIIVQNGPDTVDAKSILGLFILNLVNPLILRVQIKDEYVW